MSKRSRKRSFYAITQEELQAFRALRADFRRITDEVEALRLSLMARVESNATVEPGSLRPHINVREVRRMTAVELARILGDEAFQSLHEQIPLRQEKSFSVLECEGEDGS